MRVYQSYEGVPEADRGAVVAIGNFDGVHRGHRSLLLTARTIAEREGWPMAALTFEPHPRAVLRPDDPPARVTPPALKHHRLAEEGVEILYSIPFDWDLASRAPRSFVNGVLIDGLGARHVVVGADFRFGQLRAGTPTDIAATGLLTSAVDKVACAAGVPISASRVRTALRHGDLTGARALLGWEWELWGEVVRGDQRGRQLGYPTANVDLGASVHPSYGVYAGEVMLQGQAAWRPAAINVGIRPMFASATALVEAHILDFDGDIYGQRLRIRPARRLRGEARFNSVKDLIAQMALDCEEAQRLMQIRANA